MNDMNLEDGAADKSNPDNEAPSPNMRTLSHRQAEIELEEDENIATLIDLKRWKYNGQFNNKFL